MKIKIGEIKANETFELRHHVMWPDKSKDFVKLEEDEIGVHFGLTKDGILVSIVSLFVNEDQAQFRKFATKISEQGNGYGTMLLEHIMTFIGNKKITRIWCNARKDKASFYERFNLKQTKQKFVRDGIDYVIMEKKF